jgi:hypothetical protein
MKNVYLRASLAAVLATAALPLFAAPACKPVNGRFEAVIVPPGSGHCPDVAGALCTAGRVWGGINGNYQFVLTGAIPAAVAGGIASALFYTGKSTIFLQDGSTVVGTDSGALDPPPAGQRGFASLITFDVGAAGQIRLIGQFTDTGAGTEGEYEGQFCAG